MLLLIRVSLSSVSFEMKIVCVQSIGTGKKSGLCISLKLAEYKNKIKKRTEERAFAFMGYTYIVYL